MGLKSANDTREIPLGLLGSRPAGASDQTARGRASPELDGLGRVRVGALTSRV